MMSKQIVVSIAYAKGNAIITVYSDLFCFENTFHINNWESNNKHNDIINLMSEYISELSNAMDIKNDRVEIAIHYLLTFLASDWVGNKMGWERIYI